MKLVLFSDLHLDGAFSWMSGTPGAQALRDTLLKIVETTVQIRADATKVTGYHRKAVIRLLRRSWNSELEGGGTTAGRE